MVDALGVIDERAQGPGVQVRFVARLGAYAESAEQ
jgi:hypothetical protein